MTSFLLLELQMCFHYFVTSNDLYNNFLHYLISLLLAELIVYTNCILQPMTDMTIISFSQQI